MLQLWASLAHRLDSASHVAQARAARRATSSLLIASVVTGSMTEFLMAYPTSSRREAAISSYSFPFDWDFSFPMVLRAPFTWHTNEGCARSECLIAQAVTDGITEYSLTGTNFQSQPRGDHKPRFAAEIELYPAGRLTSTFCDIRSERDKLSDGLIASAVTSGMSEYLSTDPSSSHSKAASGCYGLLLSWGLLPQSKRSASTVTRRTTCSFASAVTGGMHGSSCRSRFPVTAMRHSSRNFRFD